MLRHDPDRLRGRLSSLIAALDAPPTGRQVLDVAAVAGLLERVGAPPGADDVGGVLSHADAVARAVPGGIDFADRLEAALESGDGATLRTALLDLDETSAACTWLGHPEWIADEAALVVGLVSGFPEDWRDLAPLARQTLASAPPVAADPMAEVWRRLAALRGPTGARPPAAALDDLTTLDD